jgi:hypothetical protein
MIFRESDASPFSTGIEPALYNVDPPGIRHWSGWQESNLLLPRSKRGRLPVTYTQKSGSDLPLVDDDSSRDIRRQKESNPHFFLPSYFWSG